MSTNIKDEYILSGAWGYAVVKKNAIWIPSVMGDLGKVLDGLYERTKIRKMIFSAVINPDKMRKHLRNIKREWNEWWEEVGDYSYCIEIEYQPKSVEYVYRWKNNSKRQSLYGRICQVLARGKMNSALVEFENGQREIISRNALRKGNDND